MEGGMAEKIEVKMKWEEVGKGRYGAGGMGWERGKLWKNGGLDGADGRRENGEKR